MEDRADPEVGADRYLSQIALPDQAEALGNVFIAARQCEERDKKDADDEDRPKLPQHSHDTAQSEDVRRHDEETEDDRAEPFRHRELLREGGGRAAAHHHIAEAAGDDDEDVEGEADDLAAVIGEDIAVLFEFFPRPRPREAPVVIPEDHQRQHRPQ